MNRSTGEGYVLLVTLGIYGHVNPFMHFARRLMKRGLSCTLLLEDKGRRCLEENLRTFPVDEEHRFRVEWVPTVRSDSPFEELDNWRRMSTPFFKKMLEDRSAGARGPTCIVADQFAGWTNTWAAKLMIKRYFFICSPTLFAYWAYNLSTFIRRDHVLEKIDEDPILDLPGAPVLRLSDSPNRSDTYPQIFSTSGDTFDDAAGLLINTVYDMEVSTIAHFASQVKAAAGREVQGQPTKCQPQWVLPIGPVAPETGGDVGSGESAKELPCIQWLDSRARESVVYIAFGSVHKHDMSRDQIREVATALEATRVSFLWILIPRGEDDAALSFEVSSLLPEGFQERTKDEGLVYPHFAPQLQVLSHPATGTFVTHCGWNSALESLARGVPLIPWPRGAEQRLCYRVLQGAGMVAHVRYGKLGEERILVESAELEKLIRTWVMDGEGRTQLKVRALELQRQARAAVAIGGSSYQNFETFVQEIMP